ncbi:adenosylcobinamide amidohydrolase [Mammaliicoccus sciuri]|uniref:Iron complex transport system ATP-binding protein n=2 Tax=Sporosarcina newyorkensis TaxID=759851 RepID=A0A1T4Y6I1_9BACL|nr:adenosylcobinamide amidohydrolase [Sporosarcina newyorkensis]EGQ26697.1 iron(III) dicitrate transport system [Sporosarcina newyorkensis 2681]SKA97346.1 iron complex transport system ATP-binding protein [Sporosarcina newyorkensis]
MLQVDEVSGGYGKEPVVRGVSFHVEKGEVLGILGPNGSGKSTLLKIISGILPKQGGKVTIDGKSASAYTQKQFARKVAVLPQLHAHAFSHTVKDTVGLGRYPHQTGLFSSWSDQDERAVQEAMNYTGITRYEDTPIELLSGGEQQRVFVAQALAQEAPILLLDEPTNHLDIAHQQQLLDTIRNQAHQKGITVVSVFHDINLAALYCDRLLLMKNGEVAAIGTPQEVVLEQEIRSVYEARVKTQPHPEMPKPQMTLLPDLKEETEQFRIMKEDVKIREDHVVLQAQQPLKTISSAVHNAGMGWYRTFINRGVRHDYHCDDVQSELADYLLSYDYQLTDTVAMMTAVSPEYVNVQEFKAEFGSIVIAVTVGIGNAVDVSKAWQREELPYIGTINTWIFINGLLSEEAFVQAMITATEAKTKALQDEEVIDPESKTIATGTSTDSLLIASTQQGASLPYAGPITQLGKLIGRGVYECTVHAIHSYRQAKDEAE